MQAVEQMVLSFSISCPNQGQSRQVDCASFLVVTLLIKSSSNQINQVIKFKKILQLMGRMVE